MKCSNKKPEKRTPQNSLTDCDGAQQFQAKHSQYID